MTRVIGTVTLALGPMAQQHVCRRQLARLFRGGFVAGLLAVSACAGNVGKPSDSAQSKSADGDQKLMRDLGTFRDAGRPTGRGYP